MEAESGTQVMLLNSEDLAACPDRIKIIPTGQVSSEKGTFFVDEESCKLMKVEMARRGIDIVIDYEHQTLKDIQAPAAGWVKELEYTPSAIVAKVVWTPKAQEYLKNKEYRYLSPVIVCRKSDNKAVKLHSLALTNMPAINGMFAIVNKSIAVCGNTDTDKTKTGGKKMDIKKLIALLGLAEDATEEQVLTVLAERLKKEDEKPDKSEENKPDEKEAEEEKVVANSVILSLLGLAEGAKTEDVAGKIMELKSGSPDMAKRLNDLAKRMEEKEADDAVMVALKAGKITADQKEWARTYALKDRAGFESFVEKAPVVVPLTKLALENAPKRKETEVSAMILKATGVSKEDIAKYANKEEEE